ncbi:MAG: ABC transporter ATP-binding protein/permease [Victivallaceae bacterium]|nr:ABC transporter ATP-binding protein/permease [Victivallaceae bacterium]
MLKKFVKYYKPHLRLLIIGMVTAVLSSVLIVAMPLIINRILREYLPDENLTAIIWSLAIMLMIAALLGIGHYINIRWGHILGVRMEADMRNDLFRHLQKLSFSYFDKTKTGHIMSRLSNDLTSIAEMAHHAPEDLTIAGCTVIGAFTVMFMLNPYLAAIALIPLPFIIGWGAIFQGRMQRGFRDVRKKVADINSQVENSIQGIREVKSYTNEKNELEKFSEVNRKFRYSRENVFGVLAIFHAGIIFLIQSYSLIVIGGGVLLMYFKLATLADVITFFMYNRFIMMPIFKLVNFNEQLQQGMAAFERFTEIMAVEPDIQDCEKPIKPETVIGDIIFENVYFKYATNDDNWVLKNINLKIANGSTVALVGESGAGKSTLASLLPRFYEAGEGSISIDGNNVLKLEQQFLRTNIGLVQQNVFLFDATLRENIMFGKPDATEAELIVAAQKANIYDFIQSLPEGFDALVGEHGVLLSGGQKQRISIARAFLKNPPILIFDEATSSLDNESEQMIQQALEELCINRTTIIIAHRLSTVRNADCTYVIKQGEIVEQGPHDELISSGGYYQQLHQMHAI